MTKVSIRSFQRDDADAIARLANNKKIWDNLRDYMPYPYTLKDAHDFIEMKLAITPTFDFAIIYEDDFVGVIGGNGQNDIYRHSAEIGYWLGEPYWGKGIASEAVKLIVEYAFNELDIKRLFTSVFDYNPASMKVLEKAGFQREGIAVKSIIKNDAYHNEVKFGLVNPKYFSV